MLSDTVLSSLITTAGTIITTLAVVLSGKENRRHIRGVKDDIREIKEALYLPTAEVEEPSAQERPAMKLPTFKEP